MVNNFQGREERKKTGYADKPTYSQRTLYGLVDNSVNKGGVERLKKHQKDGKELATIDFLYINSKFNKDDHVKRISTPLVALA